MRRKTFSKNDLSKIDVIILCGGLGIRLKKIINGIPKPMAKIANKPFLEYLINRAHMAGFDNLILCVGHKAEFIKKHFSDGRKYGFRIRYSQEQKLLGTAGALANARHLIHSEPFIVMNGDSYCLVDFDRMLKRHLLNKALATIASVCVEERLQYGGLVLGPHDSIVRYVEKEKASGLGYINCGVYVLSQKVLSLIPSGQYRSIEKDIFPFLVGHGLYAFRTSGIFIDIGTPEGYKKIQNYFK